jgi:hypothetical protein
MVDLKAKMNLTNRDDIFLLSVAANIILTVMLINLYDTIKQKEKK